MRYNLEAPAAGTCVTAAHRSRTTAGYAATHIECCASEHIMLQIGDLQNKAVLVTGASSGIGAALSRAFAGQGARVAMHWHKNEAAAKAVAQQIRAAGGTVELVQGDLSQSGVPQRVIGEGSRLLGGLDVLINNA